MGQILPTALHRLLGGVHEVQSLLLRPSDMAEQSVSKGAQKQLLHMQLLPLIFPGKILVYPEIFISPFRSACY